MAGWRWWTSAPGGVRPWVPSAPVERSLPTSGGAVSIASLGRIAPLSAAVARVVSVAWGPGTAHTPAATCSGRCVGLETGGGGR
nr:unnamed protein product [Digitaria exilis]